MGQNDERWLKGCGKGKQGVVKRVLHAVWLLCGNLFVLQRRPNSLLVSLNIPAGQCHTVQTLESGAVIMEVKDGDYEPIGLEDKLNQ